MDLNEAKKIVLEAVSRKRKLESLVNSLFPEQKSFVLSKARQKAALCTRRSGKSYGDGVYLFKEALENPGTSVLYITLTRQTAKNIMYKDVLKVIDLKYNLKATFNETLLTVTLPNKSVIYLFGIDAAPDEAEKILGQKYKLVIVDEAGSLHYDLRDIVQKIIKPTLIDLRGTLCLTGTPTDLVTGLFFDVTNGNTLGWELHKWSALCNPHVAKEFKEEMDILIAENPLVVNTAFFKQMYLGEWCIDESKLVYKYSPILNALKPLNPNDDYVYILGTDLGYEDETSFVVAAYSDYDKYLHYIHAEKFKRMLLNSLDPSEDTVETHSEALKKRWPISKFVIDGANKQAVETMKHRTKIPWEAADKADKNNFIRIMNNDFQSGVISAAPTTCQALINEWSTLIWKIDAVTGKREEHPSCPNHCCFVAGTMVITNHGIKSVENLKVCDLILTRNGYKKIKTFISRQKEVKSFIFDNGLKITATLDHPFYVINKDKFLPIDALTYNDRCIRLARWTNKYSMIMFFLGILTLLALRTGSISLALLMANLLGSTGKYGKAFMEKYLKGIIYTTKTAIIQITVSKILSVFPVKNIYQTICKVRKEKNNLGSLLKGQELKLLNGINQKQGLSGIINKVKKYLGQVVNLEKKYLKLHVLYVGTKRKLTNCAYILKFAQTTAILNKDETQEKTTLLESALTVIKHLWLINMQGKITVVVLVPQDTQMNVERVYNLEVEDTHEYFANGLLVSNCDPALYIHRHCYQYLSEPRKKKVKRPDIDMVDEISDREDEIYEQKRLMDLEY